MDPLIEAAELASLSDETPEGKSIVALARRLGSNGHVVDKARRTSIAFSATPRMSGVDFDSRVIRKGADDAMGRWSEKDLPLDVRARVDAIGRSGGTPLVVGENKVVLGTIHLKATE